MDTFSGVDHLLLGRDALLRQRDELTRAIEALDTVLRRFGVTPGADSAVGTTATAGNAGNGGGSAPSVREAILQVLTSEDRTFSMAEIIATVKSYGTKAQDDTIRSIIIKRMNVGEVERAGRGHYRLPRPENTESPAVTGLSVSETTTSTDGGEDHDPATAHPDNDSLSGWNGSHDRVPAVVR